MPVRELAGFPEKVQHPFFNQPPQLFSVWSGNSDVLERISQTVMVRPLILQQYRSQFPKSHLKRYSTMKSQRVDYRYTIASGGSESGEMLLCWRDTGRDRQRVSENRSQVRPLLRQWSFC